MRLMHRLFVAIRPPSAIRSHLLATMGGIVGARWQSDDQLHLTLRFIGEVDAPCANDIADLLGAVRYAPFTIALSGVGRFEHNGRVDTLWAGVQPRDALAALHRKIDQICIRLGLKPDGRTYLPHITLARFGRQGGLTDAFIADHAGLTSPPFQIDGFTLFESHLGHSGASYLPIARYPALPEDPARD